MTVIKGHALTVFTDGWFDTDPDYPDVTEVVSGVAYGNDIYGNYTGTYGMLYGLEVIDVDLQVENYPQE